MSLTRLLALLLLFLPLSFPTSGPAQGPPPKLDRAGDPLPAGAGIRLGTTRFRHLGPVVVVGYSADGGTLITHSDDNYLYFWDARTGRQVHKFEVKARPQRYSMRNMPSVLISGDGTTLALGVDEGNCTIVEVATRKTLKEFKLGGERNRFGGDEGFSNSLSHDGKVLVTVEGERFGGGTKILAWDTAEGKLLHQYSPKEKGDVYHSVCISRDGKTLVAVEGPSERGGKQPFPVAPGKGDPPPPRFQFRFLNVATGIEQRSIPCSVNNVTEMTLRAGDKSLVVRSRNEGVRLIDTANGKEIRQFAGKQGTLRAALLTADHKTLLIADHKHIAQLDVEDGKELRTFPASKANPEDDYNPYSRMYRYTLAVTPDGKTLAIPDQAAVSFWDIASGKELANIPGHRHRIDSVAFGPVGQLLTTSQDGKIFLWDAATSQILREFEQKPKGDKDKDDNFRMRRGGPDRIDLFKVRAVPSPDGKSVAGLWWGGKVHLWDIQTGKIRHVLGGSRMYSGFNFSGDGKHLALVGGDGAVELWDPVAGRETQTFGAPPVAQPADPNMMMDFDEYGMGAYSVNFSRDGRMVISSGLTIEPNGLKSQVKYWETATGQERSRFETRMNFNGQPNFDWITSALDNASITCCFTQDASIIAEAGFSNVRLRNLGTGREIRSFGGKQVSARTALFSPDGKMLIAGKHDGSIRIWDVATGSILLDFPAHHAPVSALAFSPDGRLLMSGSGDTSALVWDWLHIAKQAMVRKTEPALAEPEKLWADLAGKDARKAYASMRTFVSVPGETIAFLKTRLAPTPPVEAKLLAKLIEDLDHLQYDTRQKAQTALDKLGDLAADAIKERMARPMSAEMSARLGELQKKLDAQATTPELLQALRAVEILELIGTPEARTMLEALAKGVPGHRVTQEAKSSLKRLSQK